MPQFQPSKFYGRALTSSEIAAALSKGKIFSWLTDACKAELAKAIAKRSPTVTLPRPGWKEFKIRYDDDGKHIYVSPTGIRAPFGPSAWIEIERYKTEEVR